MRTARITTRDYVHHVISRFVDERWFIHNDAERAHYLLLLGRALAESDWLCVAFAIMSNHIHLGLVAGRSTLDSLLRSVNSPFAEWMNTQYNRRGPMFADRAASPCIQHRDVARVIAYIHNNPVKAGVVARARDSHWTSHRAYLGLQTIPWLACADGLRRGGFDDAAQFDAWVDAQQNDDLPELELERMRRRARQRGGIELGTPTRDGPIPLIAHPGAHIRVDPRRLVEITCDVFGVAIDVLCSKVQTGRSVDARRVVAHAGKALGLSGSWIAAALGLSPQLVSARQHERLAPNLEVLARLVVSRARGEI